MKPSFRLGPAVSLIASLLATPVQAQSVDDVVQLCVNVGGGGPGCATGAVAVRATVEHIGLMAAPGSEIPGEGSTLGRRLGGMPRVAAWVRGGVHPLALPDPAAPQADEVSSWTPSLQAGVGLGVFDGFRILPTVGGFLSLDVFGSASFLFPSGEDGFDGRVDVLSFGARVGLLRESFTLPGVTVSLARRASGDVGFGDSAAGDGLEILTDPSITSLRLSVSKDLFAFGVLAGVGWDDYSSRMRMYVPDLLGGTILVAGKLEGRRRLYFASVSKQLGILAWVTFEGGWGQGFGSPATYTGTGFDPEGSSLFGSVTLLLKL